MRRGFKILFIDFSIIFPKVKNGELKVDSLNLNHLKVIRAALSFEQYVKVLITNLTENSSTLRFLDKLKKAIFKSMDKLSNTYKTDLARLRDSFFSFEFVSYKRYETYNYFYKVAYDYKLISLAYSLFVSRNPIINNMAFYAGVGQFPKQDFDNGQLVNFKVTTTRSNF